MRYTRAAVLAFLLLFSALPLCADTQRVTVSLSSGSITDKVPFDEPFILKGTVDPQVQRLEMVLRRSKACDAATAAAEHPFDRCAPLDTRDSIATREWRRRTSGGNDFEFTIPSLDANACYELVFHQELTPAGETERALLANQLATIVRNEITAYAFSAHQRAQLDQDLSAKITSFVDSHFKACIPQNAIDSAIHKATDNAVDTTFDLATTIQDTKAGIDTDIRSVKGEMCFPCTTVGANLPTKADWTAFRARLQEIIDDPALLSPGSKAAWNGSIGETKVPDLAQIAMQVSGSPSALEGLLQASLTISGPILTSATGRDPSSIEKLANFFALVLSDHFTLEQKRADGGRSPVFSDRLLYRASTLVGSLRDLALQMRDRETAARGLAAAPFPDVLADQVLNQTFSVTTSPTVITTDKNPYISADVGYGLATRTSRGFSYAGANFYFVPVNKNAPLDRFKRRQRLLKTTSILVGLTSAKFEGEGIQNYTSSGSPMLGVGYRFNQFVKANGGVVVFKLKDANPLIDRTKTKVTPFVSLSIDLDLKSLLGNVANIF